MDYPSLFGPEVLTELFPPERTTEFFEALFGDDEEGSYDIRLGFRGGDAHQLRFVFELHQRPGKCLACNLTYGLPHVFSRHPLINVAGVVDGVAARLDGNIAVANWELGSTRETSRSVHEIPLTISLQPKDGA